VGITYKGAGVPIATRRKRQTIIKQQKVDFQKSKMAALDYVLDEPEQLVSVIAPSDMQEGYEFEVEFNGQTMIAVVPQGGVTAGQAFFTPMRNYNGPNIKAPSGHWKDGPFDCLSLGILSPHLWCAWWCTQCAMGQVMQRLRLDWLGRQTTELKASSTFKICAILFVAYTIYTFYLDIMSKYVYSGIEYTLRTIGQAIFLLWTVYALANTRAFVRAKYQIPEEACPGCEDVCCALFCQCCTIAQIARHTGQHEEYPSVCVSETGLPPQAPMLV